MRETTVWCHDCVFDDGFIIRNEKTATEFEWRYWQIQLEMTESGNRKRTVLVQEQDTCLIQ